MTTFVDQIGRRVEIKAPPKRIISLVPSQTELLCDLGLEGNLVGITKFCVHPDHIFKSRPRIGGTKQFDYDQINALQPDLIIANKEENPRPAVLELAEKYPVYVTDVGNVNDALEMITVIGEITYTHQIAHDISAKIQEGATNISTRTQNTPAASALYLIWKDPYMAAGTDTFISDMMRRCGFSNCLVQQGEKGLRYPRLNEDEIKKLSPDFIFLSSEPYPFKEKHVTAVREFANRACTLVDGEAFSWYGSRMVESFRYLDKLVRRLHQMS